MAAQPTTGRRGNPNIQWELAEQLYVRGGLVDGKREYPALALIAELAGTSKGNIQQRAKRHNWLQMRAEYAIATDGVSSTLGTPIAATTPANPAKSKRRSAEEIVLDYLDLFDRCVQKGAVRTDALGDFDKAVRVLAFLRGQADQRKQVDVVVSLATLQTRHAGMRARAALIGDEVAGVIATADAIDALGEAVDEAAKPLALDQGNPAMRAAIEAAWRDSAPDETNTLPPWEAAARRAATGTDDD